MDPCEQTSREESVWVREGCVVIVIIKVKIIDKLIIIIMAMILVITCERTGHRRRPRDRTPGCVETL